MVAANGFAISGTDSPILRQRGAVLLMVLVLFVLVSCALVFKRPVRTQSARLEQDAVTARSLFEARRALIARAVTLSAAAGKNVAPGLLPFPDRNRDGNYDGKGDCVTFGLNPSHLLGRLPWAGDAPPCPRTELGIHTLDGAGEHLWYAVSRNLLVRGRAGPVNPDMGDPGRAAYPWIVLRNARGDVFSGLHNARPLAVAAVILAPGFALWDQRRIGPAPGPSEFLDGVRIGAVTFDNADADGCPDAGTGPCAPSPYGEEFIVFPNAPVGSGFNDRLTYITVAELMRAVEKRALGEAAIALSRYRTAFGAYPWLAEFHNPRLVPSPAEPSFNSALLRAGQLPVHLPIEVFTTRIGGSWRFVDSTPTTAIRHSGDVKLVPPLADVMSGSIQVARDSGRCTWSDWTGGNCIGSQKIPDHYRVDLDKTVTRNIEYSFSIVDDSPHVSPPTAGDVRRRTLFVNLTTAPSSISSTWNVRITDDDGLNSGQRDIFVDADTQGEITLSDIRYELSVVYDDTDDERDELPEWFVENNWHHFIYVALSADAAPGGDADGDGDCATPVSTCLILKVAGKTARSDVRALLVSSGGQLPGQNRSTGDCDGDGSADEFLCAYFEGDNSDRSTAAAADAYARDPLSATFNDQIRIVEPLPP